MIEEHKLQEGYEPSSMDVAALIISNGQTTDPHLAVQISDGTELDPEQLIKAGLRRSMGFDFTVTFTSPNRALIESTEGPRVSAVAKYLKTDDEEARTTKLVTACLKLKEKWDTAVAELEKEDDERE